jgi:hypothetical protein
LCKESFFGIDSFETNGGLGLRKIVLIFNLSYMHRLILGCLFSIHFNTMIHIFFGLLFHPHGGFRPATNLISNKKLNAFVFDKEPTNTDLALLFFRV